MPRPVDLQLSLVCVALLAGAAGQACRTGRATGGAGVTPAQAPLSIRADSEMVTIAAGSYIEGSTPQEREQAYADYLASSGRDSARRGAWFKHEAEAHTAHLLAYAIDKDLVTQGAFAEFVAARNLSGPAISESQWRSQGFIQDYLSEVQRYNWSGPTPPAGREQHPVVLVTHAEAAAYCQWRGLLVGESRALPSASQFEKAARGPQDAPYPWGENYDPSMLNSSDRGPRDTLAIGSHPHGVSALGVEALAGNVFQWTSTPWPHSPNRMTVKGSAWDDHGGVGRAASAHGRRPNVRHAIVGFRCATPLR